jgi:hypothetical protein
LEILLCNPTVSGSNIDPDIQAILIEVFLGCLLSFQTNARIYFKAMTASFHILAIHYSL